MHSDEIRAIFDPRGAMIDVCRQRAEEGGFDEPVKFYQAELIHAGFSRRVSGNAAVPRPALPGR